MPIRRREPPRITLRIQCSAPNGRVRRRDHHHTAIPPTSRPAGPDPDTLLLKEIIIRGSFVYGAEFDTAIGLLTRGDIRVYDLTTVIMPIEKAREAFEMLRWTGVVKVLIAPNG
ncbi:hypothetical protein ABZV34_31305 [Streptomyces sp. NPDC005195]|uniref:hypothetical protein n=1 Tax=Streptomyces sp. NPDC005195 TaxID=3154561 RepID=UPI0033B7B0FF